MDADMEFRGEGTPEDLRRVFAEIMSIPMEDAIRFDLELLGAGYIREDDQYGGVRVTTPVYHAEPVDIEGAGCLSRLFGLAPYF